MKNNEHYIWAKEIKKKYPQHTNGLSIEQIQNAWEEHSDDYAAGWLADDEETVKRVMEKTREENDHTDDIDYGMADTLMGIFGLRRVTNQWINKKNKNITANMFSDESDIVYLFNTNKKKSGLINAIKYSKFQKMIKKWKINIKDSHPI